MIPKIEEKSIKIKTKHFKILCDFWSRFRGVIWIILETFCRSLGASELLLGHFVGALGHFCRALGRSWLCLGRFWVFLGTLGVILDRLLVRFGFNFNRLCLDFASTLDSF